MIIRTRAFCGRYKKIIKIENPGVCRDFRFGYNGHMKKKVEKTSDENELVTKGFLKESLVKEFDSFRQEMNLRFLAQEERFNKIDNVLLLITRELSNMREENKEFYRMCEQLYHNDVVQEAKIDDLEFRVKRLEIA